MSEELESKLEKIEAYLMTYYPDLTFIRTRYGSQAALIVAGPTPETWALPPAPPPPAAELYQVLPAVTVRVRAAPSLSGAIVYSLSPHTFVLIEQGHITADSWEWGKLAEGEQHAGHWVALRNVYTSVVLLKRVVE